MTPRRCLSSIAEAKFSEFVAVRVRVHNLPPGTIVSFELAVGVLAGWLIAVKPDTCWPMIRGSHALPPETFSYYGPKRTRSSLSMAMWGGPLFERVGRGVLSIKAATDFAEANGSVCAEMRGNVRGSGQYPYPQKSGLSARGTSESLRS